MTATAHDDATLLLDHPIGRHGRIVIRLASAEVRLIAEPTDRVTVRVPGGRSLPDRVVLETTDGGLTIREGESLGLSFGAGRGVVQVEIGVPAEAEVTVDTASGWIDARGLRGVQHYRTASGDVRLQGTAGRIELNAVSGDATLELAGPADLAIRTVSGDVSVSGGSVTALRLQTTSGDVRLDSPVGGTGHAIETLSGDVSLVAAEGMRVEARTVSGDLSSDLPHRTEGRMGRRTLIVGDGATELTFRSVSGDLHIHGADGGGSPISPGKAPSTISHAVPGFEDRLAIPQLPAIPPLPGRPSRSPTPPLPPLPGSSPVGSTASHVDTPAGDPAASRDHDTSQSDAAAADPDADERMAILRALEAGEIDVAVALDRLAALDAKAGEPDA